MQEGWLSKPFSLAGKSVWIAGHGGMVGSALVRRLRHEPCEILTADFDFRVQADVDQWMKINKPHVAVIAAAKVGGIVANRDHPADFLMDNILIEANIIRAAYKTGVEKLLFLGSSCIYPKEADIPIKESALLCGALEATNEFYAVAKIAGLKLCAAYRQQYGCDFISVMPCNLYGPGDRFDEAASHVIPALMMKAHKAKMMSGRMEVWGTGRPRREFLYVDDLADALVFSLKNYSSEIPLNIGSGVDMAIADLTKKIAEVVGFKGEIVFDASKPDGTMRKLLDSSRILNAGWTPIVDFDDGLHKTYSWFKEHKSVLRRAA